jgi:hypothetical protein
VRWGSFLWLVVSETYRPDLARGESDGAKLDDVLPRLDEPSSAALVRNMQSS